MYINQVFTNMNRLIRKKCYLLRNLFTKWNKQDEAPPITNLVCSPIKTETEQASDYANYVRGSVVSDCNGEAHLQHRVEYGN